MTRVWGHAIPDTPTDKCWRACYRAASTKCLMWDMSYLKVVEVVGDRKVVMENMNRMTDCRTGSVFSDGPGERSAVVYRPGQYPAGVVGEVSYMWRPEEGGGEEGLLWVWVHPEVHGEFVDIMTDVLELEAEEYCCEPDLKKVKLDEPSPPEKNVVLSKLEPKLSPPTVLLCPGMRVTMLGNNLNRFRLVGPLSSALLRHCMVPAAITTASTATTATVPPYWWAGYYSSQERKCMAEESSRVWGEWSSVPPKGSGRMVGLVVRDPRLILPDKRNSAKLDVDSQTKSVEITDLQDVGVDPSHTSEETQWRLQQSPLWCSSIRSSVSLSRQQDSEINTARSAALVQGTPLDMGDMEGRVPVMLVEQIAGKEGGGQAGM